MGKVVLGRRERSEGTELCSDLPEQGRGTWSGVQPAHGHKETFPRMGESCLVHLFRAVYPSVKLFVFFPPVSLLYIQSRVAPLFINPPVQFINAHCSL